ncbi:MAG: rod shape-determining protein RodA [Candidatus Gygaella obscura]|nr:rod shape-determining protein RodA [Candidatus Gygaella obscura]
MRKNFSIILIPVVICLIGIFSIYTNTYLSDNFVVGSSSLIDKINSFFNILVGKQIVWLLISLCVYWLVSCIYYRRLYDVAYFLYAFLLLLLVFVFVLGIVRLGAQRWLKIGFFNFQPSEFAKICIVLVMARYFDYRRLKNIKLFDVDFARGFVLPVVIVGIPCFLIAKQPDLGSAIIVFLILVSILYVKGFSLKWFLLLAILFLIAFPFVWSFLEGYQKQRLLVFVNPNMDPLGAGYTVIQSKIAVGSGGFFGKGWLSGTQSQLHFLPEAHTDFIFATWAEERGFFGSAILVTLYALLIKSIIDVGLKAKDNFAKLICVGIASMFGFQISINILMTIGLSPVVGLPLPFMSYGGSSLLISFISLGIISNIKNNL